MKVSSVDSRVFASVNGLPIESNWLASYMQGGLFGVVVCALILAWLFMATLFQPPGLRRALALFILTYCLLASFTEDAFTDASTYLLDLVVAASLLVIAILGHYQQGSPDLDESDIRPGV